MSTVNAIILQHGSPLRVVARRNLIRARLYPVFALAAGLTIALNSGCFVHVPIALYVAPEQGSGAPVRFVDRAGEPLKVDGLLIVHRSYVVPLGITGLTGAPSNRVVRIISGESRLPNQWVPKLLTFGPHLYGFPSFRVWPDDVPTLFPIASGYFFHPSNAYDPGCRLPPDGRVVLDRAEKYPLLALRYYERLRQIHIRTRFQNRKVQLFNEEAIELGPLEMPRYVDPLRNPDLRLRRYDYDRVRRALDAEIDRLKMRHDLVETTPSADRAPD